MAREIKVSLTGDSRSLERAFNKAGSAGSGLHSKMGLLGRSGSAVGDLLATGLKVGALGAAAGMGIATKMAGDYEQRLNVFQATAGATGAQMQKVGKLALKLGADTKLPATSAADAAEAMTMLARGGLSVGNTMKATRGVLQLSAAAQISNAEAADITAKALKAFGLAGSHAAEVADQLAGATRAGVPVQDMGLALKAASAVAKQFGLDLGDTTTALTMLGQAGITGSDAGTSLKTMLQSLVPTGKPAIKAMKDLGVNVKDSTGHFLPFTNIIGQFKTGLQKLTPYQQAFAVKTIFGSDATRAANIILGKGTKAYELLREKITKTGQAQLLAQSQTKGFNGAMQGFRSTIETLAISIGTKVLPKASQFLRFLTRVAGASSLKVAIKVVWEGIQDIAKELNTQLFGGDVKHRIDIPVAVALRQGRPGIMHEQVHGIVFDMKDGLEKAVASINWTGVGKSIAKGIGNATKGAHKDASWSATFETMAQDAGPEADKFANNLASDVGHVLGKGLRLAFGGALKIGIAAFKDPGNALNVVRDMGSLLVRTLTLPLRLAHTLVQGIINETIGKAIAAALPFVKSKASSVGTAIANGIKTAPGKLAGLAGDLVKKIGSSIAQVAGWAFSKAREIGFMIADGVISGVGNLASRLGAKIKDAASGAVSWAGKALSGSGDYQFTIHKVGKPLAEGIILGFIEGTRELPEKISSKLKGSIESARNRIENLRGSFSTAFGRLGTDAMSAFDATTTRKLDVISAKFQKWRDKATKDLAAGMGAIDANARSLTPSEQALQDLQGSHDQAGRNADLARGQSDLAAATTPEEQAAAQKEIDDAVYNQRIFDLGVLAAAERAKVDADAETAKTKLQQTYDDQNTAWDVQQAKETLDRQSQRDLKKRHLEDMLGDLQENLNKHPKAWRKAHAKIMKIFEEEFGPDFKTAGDNLGTGFRESLIDDFKVTGALLGNVGAAIRNALSDENVSAVSTAAKPKKLAAGGIVTRPTFALVGEAGPEAVIPLSGGGMGGGLTVNVYPQNLISTEKELVEMVRNELIRTGRTTTGGAFGRFA